MTENKRFTINDCRVLSDEQVLKILNQLTEENSKLHTQNDFLKDENQHMRTVLNENKELKKELKIYREIARCSNCKYHNYDWFDDGDEFEVCDKGNDVYNNICEEWEEL